MPLRPSALALLFAALLAVSPSAQPADAAAPLGPKSLAATSVAPGAIDLDGRLDDAAWSSAAPATDFVQLRPTPGDAASEATEARVLYDGSALYVGMRMHDRDARSIDAPLARRDADPDNSDWAVVALDSYHDRRTAFVFSVNPAGVQGDLLIYDDVNEDDSWDAVWEAKTSRDGAGWSAEFRIPLSQLRYAAGRSVQAWGVQFARDIARTGEQTFWSPIDPGVNGIVSQFGTLSDLRDLRAPRSLEVAPYVAGSVTRAPGDAADPFYSPTDASPRAGVDLKYGLTSDVTLTATLNPDFGQVEADPAQVNLGGFELFFEERRPFFVEGADVFSMEPRRFFSNNRPTLLYTRRIGRSPQRESFVPREAFDAAGDNGTVYTDAPGQTTILGAAKVSGRIGKVSFGFLDAVTSPEYGRFHAFDGTGASAHEDRALVEPASNYLVGRARTTVGETRVGGLLTAVHRATGDPAVADLLPRQSYVGGLDVEHPFAGDWVFSAQLAGSLLEGDPDAILGVQTAFPRLFQRPDADNLNADASRSTLAGATGEINVIKASGEHWLGSVHAGFTSPGFDSNDLGFQSRADAAGVGGVLVYNQNQPQGAFRRYGANVFAGSEWNGDGDRLGTFVGLNANGQLQNFWGFGVNGNAWTRSVDDRATRGGPLTGSPAGARINANVWSDDRKPVSAYAWSGANRNELGSWFWGAETGIEARPSTNVTLRFGPEFRLSHTAQQYVTSRSAPAMHATFGRRYVFAAVDQTSVSASLRADWTFTPTLSLQLYARPFIATGRYSEFKQLGAPGQLEFPVFGEDVGTATENADGSFTLDPGDGTEPFTVQRNFTLRSLQGNAVLRWEWRPGSTLFLVWQQQREGFERRGDFRGRDDLRDLFRDDLTNVFLLKLSYWLG